MFDLSRRELWRNFTFFPHFFWIFIEMTNVFVKTHWIISKIEIFSRNHQLQIYFSLFLLMRSLEDYFWSDFMICFLITHQPKCVYSLDRSSDHKKLLFFFRLSKLATFAFFLIYFIAIALWYFSNKLFRARRESDHAWLFSQRLANCGAIIAVTRIMIYFLSSFCWVLLLLLFPLFLSLSLLSRAKATPLRIDSCWNFMGLFETLMIIFVLSLWFYLFYFSSPLLFLLSSSHHMPATHQSPKVTQAPIKMSAFVVNLPGRMKEKRACELCWMKNNCIRWGKSLKTPNFIH